MPDARAVRSCRISLKYDRKNRSHGAAFGGQDVVVALQEAAESVARVLFVVNDENFIFRTGVFVH